MPAPTTTWRVTDRLRTPARHRISAGGDRAHPPRGGGRGCHGWSQAGDGGARGGLLGLRDLGGQRFGHGGGLRGVPPRDRHPPVLLVLSGAAPAKAFAPLG